MKTIMIILLSVVALQAKAAANRDVKCSLTRYTTEIGADGQKKNEKTVGIQDQTISWSSPVDNRAASSLDANLGSVSLSASMFSNTCWDDDRQVECNLRGLMLMIYQRNSKTSITTNYDLNSQSGQMSLTMQNDSGYYQIKCSQ